jgi:DNA-binding LytR/AlgR family response regulator
MRVLIVDDEAPARRRIARQLAELPGVTVAGEAEDGLDALDKIEALSPELLLLDIDMPALDGLTLASRVRALPPIVFVTAHAEHALAAFELHAVDYLLKPVRPERLAQAIERARIRVERGERRAEPEAMALAMVAPARESPRVVSASRGVTRIFDARELTRLWSRDKYTAFVSNGEEHLCEESLNALEARLAPHGFLRVHRAELVNLRRVRALHHSSDGAEVELDDGQRAAVSRRTLAQVKAALGV